MTMSDCNKNRRVLLSDRKILCYLHTASCSHTIELVIWSNARGVCFRVDASVSVHRPDSIPRHCLDYVDSNKHDATGDEDVDDSNSVDEEVRRSISFRCIVDRRSSTETIATAGKA